MSDLSPIQFGKTAAGVALPPIQTHPVPLAYHRAPASQMTRRAVVDPSVDPKQVKGHRSAQSAAHDYWSPEVRITHGQRGPLKKPRVSPNPNVVDPHTVAFADSHQMGPSTHYLDYLAVRPDQTGQGHARRLVEDFAQMHEGSTLHFGKVMHPAIWHLKEGLEKQGVQTLGHRDF